MYTNCPECGTVFRISTNELRVAEGYARCGHCSATFNALATLADELPPTITLRQLDLPNEPDTGVAVAPEDPAPEPDIQTSPPEPQAPTAPTPLPVSEDTLEFDIPEDSWSNFFEVDGGKDQPAQAQTAVGAGDGQATVQAGLLHQALAAEAGGPSIDADADWEALLAEVQDDGASPKPVYVISEEPAEKPGEELLLPEPSLDDPLPGRTRLRARLPADFAAELPGAAEAAPEPGPDPGEHAADHRPFLWEPPAPPAAIRSSRHWAYTAGSVLLALLLLMQVLHRQRDEVATNPALTAALQRTYAALGLPLWPAWDLQAYELRNKVAESNRSNPGALDILARIAVVGNEPVGLPLVRVTLLDRLSRPLGSRVFQPEEYIRGNSLPETVVKPGTQIPVEISLKDPGTDALGFDVDVCVMSRREGVICRAEREPFAR
jgi:predicted Zn finger-like uncharacterized protein